MVVDMTRCNINMLMLLKSFLRFAHVGLKVVGPRKQELEKQVVICRIYFYESNDHNPYIQYRTKDSILFVKVLGALRMHIFIHQ